MILKNNGVAFRQYLSVNYRTSGSYARWILVNTKMPLKRRWRTFFDLFQNTNIYFLNRLKIDKKSITTS